MNNRIHKLLMMLVVFALTATLLPMYAYATTVSVLDGEVSITDTKNNISVSNGVVTVTGKGGLFGGTTNTVTITNETDTKSKLTFSYSASTYSEFSESSPSGTKSADLQAGASITMSIKGTSGLSNQNGVLILSDFSLVPIADTSNVTYEYDSTLGSVTAGGTAIASGTIQAVSGETGVALVAAPVTDARFLGWINEADGNVLSTATSYTLIPAQTMTVKAVFAKDGGTPWFGVGGTTQKSQSCGTANAEKIYYYEVGVTHLFDDLNTAADAAGGKAVVLMNSGTLESGDYTIPAGVTLLIPFDLANTMYTTAVQYTDTYTQPSEYRTLTMAEGSNLVINGAMSVSAKQKYAAGGSTQGGVPVGNTGFVRMSEGSTITVNNGGALYAYGYVIGSGTVTAKSGSTVYEGFQIMDFRGGSQSSGMKNNVFPTSQYYVQNIEVPLTLEAGATEHAYTWMTMNLLFDYYYNSDIEFIGSDKAMFKISSGSVTKRYDPGADRLIIEVDGDMDISSVSLTFGSDGSISSEQFVLGLNGNISVTINSGTTNINQDLAMLPSAHITIKEGATVLLGEGKRIYVYDKDEWGAYVHLANTAEATARPLIYVPTRDPQINEDTTGAHLTDASILIEGTLDASQGTIYTTLHGAQITGSNGGKIITKPGTETITYQLKDQKTSNDPDDAEYAEIPITPAKLINSDATIVETGNGSADSVTTYTYTNGFWRCDTHTWGDDGKCTVCGVFAIYGTSVRAGDSLGMYFYVEVQHLFPDTNSANLPRTTDGHFYANVAHAKADGSTETTEKIVGELYQDAYYRFYFTGVAAKEMADMVYVSIYDNSDTLVSNVYSESVENYAVSLLEAIGENPSGRNALLQQTLVDMLNYGAACQSFFEYNKDDFANASLTDAQKQYSTSPDCSAETSGTTGYEDYFVTHSVSVENSLKYTFVFKNLTGTTAEVSYTDHYGSSKTLTIPITVSGSEYLVDVSGLAIADACPTPTEDNRTSIDISCTVTTASGSVTVTGSIEAYAKDAIAADEAAEVCKMLMRFSASAYEYLHEVIKSA